MKHKRFLTVSVAFVAGLWVVSTFAAKLFPTELGPIKVEVVADGLDHPWGMAFLPNGDILVTERSGQMRIVSNGQVGPPIAGVPEVAEIGQGGLLDVALHPNFDENRWVYFTYSAQGEGGAGTAVARGKLQANGRAGGLEEVADLFRMSKFSGAGRHFGSRIVFAPDGTIFVTIGDRADRERAQDPRDHAGSVLRLNDDGSIPPDNPFAQGQEGVNPEIWSIGHRNPQGAAIRPSDGALWINEHGPRGGDEVNKPQAGLNYGWPKIGYGRHYSGGQVGVGTKAPGLEQPIFYWDPSIAPSGMAFYTGDLFPEWKGDLFVGALKFQLLVRLELEGDRVVSEERLLADQYGRIRDVRSGPDGAIWLLTDDSDGKILRIVPDTR